MNFLVLGDSHTMYFSEANLHQTQHYFDVFWMEATSSRGIMNPDSRSKANPVFIQKITETTHDNIVLVLGEVDLARVVPASIREGFSTYASIQKSITPLFEFIETYCRKFNNVIVVGPNLPVVKDAYRNHVNHIRREVFDPISARTYRTVCYNALLRETCVTKGYRYIDVNDKLVDHMTGLLNFDQFAPKQPGEHHLISSRVWNFYVDSLNDVLDVPSQ